MGLDNIVRKFNNWGRKPIKNYTTTLTIASGLTTGAGILTVHLFSEGNYFQGAALSAITAYGALTTYLSHSNVSKNVELGLEMKKELEAKTLETELKNRFHY